MNNLEVVSLKEVLIKKVTNFKMATALDILSIEEPLEIRILYGPEDQKRQKNISITMSPPCHDKELALGFYSRKGLFPPWRW
ncbi:hypothetical protein D3C72_1744830 [compost metagenome]